MFFLPLPLSPILLGNYLNVQVSRVLLACDKLHAEHHLFLSEALTGMPTFQLPSVGGTVREDSGVSDTSQD